jgi:hypothetical protein
LSPQGQAAQQADFIGDDGNTERDFHVERGYSDLDLSLARTFKLPFETQSLQFRTESFNLANRVNFSNPTATVFSKADGTISTASDPRILKFALKYSF